MRGIAFYFSLDFWFLRQASLIVPDRGHPSVLHVPFSFQLDLGSGLHRSSLEKEPHLNPQPPRIALIR